MKSKVSAKEWTIRIARHIFLLPLAFSMFIPFLWMITTSFKLPQNVFTFPPSLFDKVMTLENYQWLFSKVPFFTYFLNSLKITACVTAGQLFTCALGGYVFARLRFKFREAIFLLYLATMMVPFHVTLIPLFIIFKNLGLIDSHYSLILPALTSAFGTFLMRQFFITMPDELEQAAKIDGCSTFMIFWRIFLPLSKPALTTLGIFIFNGVWTDYLAPLVFLISPQKMTLTIGIAMLQGTYATSWGLLMAGLTISVLPVLTLFLAAQDIFVKGIVMTGLKA